MDIRALQRRIAGTVVESTDAAYEADRRSMVWNALTPARRPRLIVHAASEADVVEAVAFAGASDLAVVPRGGGHHWNGLALRDDALLLDLSRLRDVSIDPAARRAAVQPTVTNRELARRLGAQGLAFPFGHCGSVGLSGYLLCGGLGWNSGAWGPACHSIAAVDVVTADGTLVTATDTQHADLLWAARGAGPAFFGVVTRYHLALQPLPRGITTSTYVYPLERLADVVAWASAIRPALPASVEVTLLLTSAPPPAAARCPSGKVCVVAATAFADSEDHAVAALAPFDAAPFADALALGEAAKPTPFEALFDIIDASFVEGHRYLADALWSNAAPAEVLAVLEHHVSQAPSPQNLILGVIPPHQPAVTPAPPAAFSALGRFITVCYAIWPNAEDDDANRAWHRDSVALLEPFASGRYVGEADLAVAGHAAASFTPQTWERLAKLRRTYDPHGLFPGLR